MVCGGCASDAEFAIVGEKNSRKCSVSLAVGKRNDETVWSNVVAWHAQASILCVARKCDPVLVIGRIQSREYKGKEYKDLVAEFVIVSSISAVGSNAVAPFPAGDPLDELPEEQAARAEDGRIGGLAKSSKRSKANDCQKDSSKPS